MGRLSASLVSLCSFLLCSSMLLPSGAARAGGEGEVLQVSFHSQSLAGNRLFESATRSVSIYLPPSYHTNREKRYPTLYVLHGFGSSPSGWFAPCARCGQLKTSLDEQIAAKVIREIIVVVPDNSTKYGGSWYTNSASGGNWLDFNTTELVAFIDSNYRTLPQRENRGLMGHSMGGYGALNLALGWPELYGAVWAMSPAHISEQPGFVNWLAGDWSARAKTVSGQTDPAKLSREQRMVGAFGVAFLSEGGSAPNFPLQLEEKHRQQLLDSSIEAQLKRDPKRLNGMVIGLDCGAQELYMHPWLNSLASQLREQGVEVNQQIYPGDHTSGMAKQTREQVLPFFSARLAPARG